MLSEIKIGERVFRTKKATKMFLRDIRESGFVSENDSAHLQAFFGVSAPVVSWFNHEMNQYELWSGEKRLSVAKSIDFAFAGGDEKEIDRIKRASLYVRARNAVFWEGSKRRQHLETHPFCVQCGKTERLEADHLGHCQFIKLWEEYCEEYTLITDEDEERWREFHESRVEYQTLCRECHHGVTSARAADHSAPASD
jgi:hypothetical protein